MELTDSTALNGGSDGVVVQECKVVADLTSATCVFDVVVSRCLTASYFLKMPAFDPVRDAIRNTPDQPQQFIQRSPQSPTMQRRATHLSSLLNDSDQPAHRQSSIHSLLSSHPDDTLASVEPIRRASMDLNYVSPSSTRKSDLVESPRPSSSGSLPPRSTASPAVAAPITLPYAPKRITKPASVMIPLSKAEIEQFRNYRGEGVALLTGKRKRAASQEPELVDIPAPKRHAGDVGVVVEHCQSMPFASHIVCADHLRFLASSRDSHRQRPAGCGHCPATRFAYHWPQKLQQLGQISADYTIWSSGTTEKHCSGTAQWSRSASYGSRQGPRPGMWEGWRHDEMGKSPCQGAAGRWCVLKLLKLERF